MKSWNLRALDLKPRLPEILSSTSEARAIALDLRAGEAFQITRYTSGRGS
jgi:hypothetical protein